MMPNNKQQKKEQMILSIYPNSIGFGYAVMNNALSVLNSKVVQIKPVSNTLAIKRVREIIDYYEPKIVVIEDYKGIGSRKSKRIQKMIDSIFRYASKKKGGNL